MSIFACYLTCHFYLIVCHVFCAYVCVVLICKYTNGLLMSVIVRHSNALFYIIIYSMLTTCQFVNVKCFIDLHFAVIFYREYKNSALF